MVRTSHTSCPSTDHRATRRALENRDFTVGDELKRKYGLEKHHPIILVPGIVSTGLENWSTDELARSWFRKRLWVRNVQEAKRD